MILFENIVKIKQYQIKQYLNIFLIIIIIDEMMCNNINPCLDVQAQ